MTVERLLQLHVAVLAALGTLLLGMGQRDIVLPVLSIFAAATSVYFTDTVRWLVLNRTLGNIAALGAVLIASFQFWTIAADQQLLAIANLLVYLQIILLYQQKTSTRYWEIAVLSLLQVVVAAALNLGFEFGVLLIIYMLTAFSGLSLFFIYREGLHFCEFEAEAGQPTAAVAPKRRSLRRQLLGEPVQATSLMPQTTFADGMTGWNFVRNVGALGLMTLLFTVVLFFSVPRTSNAVWQGHSDAVSQTGFEQEVTLNERNNIRQSEQVVMRVTFRRPGEDKPMMISGEPYFYGTALTKYSTDSGISRWSNPHTQRGNRLVPPPAGAEVVNQEIVLNTAVDSILFSAPAVFAPEDMTESENRRLRFDWRSGQLRRRLEDPGSSRSFAYTLATTGFHGNWQLPVTQHQVRQDLLQPSENNSEKEVADLRAELLSEREAWLLQIDREAFPQLIATAEKVLEGADLQSNERVVAATLLKDHFRTPEAYAYTLDFSKIPRNKDIDPIEDFVANHRTGHCEYFASALCLMLRSQGIPARMVVGYKGGEYNSVGGYYWVRQLHAHAWVEAYLEPHQIPKGAIDPALVTETGAWLRLDPTPASDGADELTLGVNLLARVGDAMDYMQLLWDDYVLGLNSERQKKSIFTPLGDKAAGALSGIFDKASWPKAFSALADKISREGDGRRWFSWRAGLIASIVTASLIVLYQLAALLWRMLGHWRQLQRARLERPERRVVEFYERLERLLAELGIARAAHQTQREFASAASLQLAALGGEADGLAPLPAEVVDAFYRVRFGEAPLAPQEATAIDQALARLAAFIDRPRSGAAS